MTAAATVTPTRAHLRDVVRRRFALSTELPMRIAQRDATRVATACRAMARRFEAGGRLLVFGLPNEASDVAHVAVEFVHPVLIGKRALPALALSAAAVRADGDARNAFAETLATLGRASDIALAIGRDGWSEPLRRGLAAARGRGMLTVGLTSGEANGPETDAAADFVFAVPTLDRMAVQEVHETLYHVMWELVHVFFEPGRRA